MRVLIIDSNSSHETLYRRKFLFLTATIDFASSLLEAKKLLINRQYDAVFVSHVLKGTSGNEIINNLGLVNSPIPIAILASGNHIDEISTKYESKQICGIINKGQNNEDFTSEVRSLLNMNKSRA